MFDQWYFLLVIPAVIISLIASANVRGTFSKFDKFNVLSGVNSNDVVSRIFNKYGIYDVSINNVRGKLTDNYNPKYKSLNLSESTANKSTISAIGVAAHEAGHAIQYQKGYFPVRLRSTMVPVANIGSSLGIIFAIAGLWLSSELGSLLLTVGIALYSVVFIFTLVTLPVEFNASKRAVAALSDMGIFTEEELSGVKKVLRAAAWTYVAAMIATLANLLRLILLSGRRGRR